MSSRTSIDVPVCFVSHTNEPGGAELALETALRARTGVGDTLLDLSHSPRSCPGVGIVSFPMPKELTQSTRRAGVRQIVVLVPLLLRYEVKLFRLFRERKEELVYVNSLMSGLIAAGPAKLAGKIVVWHLRDRLDAAYLGSTLRAILVRQFVRLTADGVIANSEGTLKAGGKGLHRRPSLVSFSPLAPVFVEQSKQRIAARSQTRRDNSAPVRFGVLARLADWKGQEEAIRAVAELTREGYSLQLDLAGGPLFGSEHYAAGLQRLMRELKMDHKIQMRGHVSDVPKWLENIDILLHYTRVPEPFGQGVVQALLCGVPVIASNAGGPAEIAERFQVPIDLVDPDDFSTLTAAMRDILASGVQMVSHEASTELDELRKAVDPNLSAFRVALFLSALVPADA